MLVSIIVMLENTSRNLDSMMYDLICQDYEHRYMELIFVCQSSAQSEKLQHYKIDLTSFHRVVITSKCNLDLSILAGVCIVSIPLHLRIPDNWISNHIHHMQKQMICGGKVTRQVKKTALWNALRPYQTSKQPKVKETEHQSITAGYIPYAMYHRTVLEHIDYFERNEFLFQQECRRYGYEVCCDHTISSYLIFSSKGQSMLDQCQYYLQLGEALTYKEHAAAVILTVLAISFSLLYLHPILPCIALVLAIGMKLYFAAWYQSRLSCFPILLISFTIGLCKGIFHKLGRRGFSMQRIGNLPYSSNKIPGL